MNFLSLNIRGIKEKEKVRWVNQLKDNHLINFVCLQETHCPNDHTPYPYSLWGNSNFNHDFIPSTGSEGRSGGILSLWDPFFFTLTNTHKSQHFLLTSGHINGIQPNATS